MGAGKGKGGGDKEWGGVGEHGGEMRGRDVRPEAHARGKRLDVPSHDLWDIKSPVAARSIRVLTVQRLVNGIIDLTQVNLPPDRRRALARCC